MTTNQEWLFSLTLEEYLEWMESEHYEPNPDCSAMLYRMFTENMKHEPCSDYEPKDNGDSRDKIEADVRKIADAYNMDTQRHGTERFEHELYYSIIHLLERQAAITERETTKRHELFCETCEAESDKQIAELKAERVKLRSQICKLEDDLVGVNDERDNWKANCEDWKKDCERYREKFGKCLDYADAIHALMDDEGMA